MKSLLKIFPILLLGFINNTTNLDPINYSDEHSPWKLTVEEGNLKVYKRTRAGTSLKELRIDHVFNVSGQRVVDVLNDADSYTKWIFKCSEAKTLARPSGAEIIYYTRANVPSPVWDRDVVAHSVYHFDENTRTHHFKSSVPENHEEYVPDRYGEKVIRIMDYGASWEVREVGENKVETRNTVYADPAGSIPNWLVNMTLTKGPLKTARALEKYLDEN